MLDKLRESEEAKQFFLFFDEEKKIAEAGTFQNKPYKNKSVLFFFRGNEGIWIHLQIYVISMEVIFLAIFAILSCREIHTIMN